MRINNPNLSLSENSEQILVFGKVQTNHYILKGFINFDSS